MTTIAIDSETRGLDFHDPAHRAFLITWADESGQYSADVDDPAGVERFKAALDAADTVVLHNAKFDAHQIREAIGVDILAGKAVHDTDLMSRVLFPENARSGRGGHGLKNLSKVYLRADADESEKAIEDAAKAIGLRTLKQTGAYYDVWRAYPELMERYAVNDARFTYDLYERFKPELNGLADIYDLEMKVLPILLRAEQRGIKTDQEAALRLKRQYETEQRELHTYLESELGPQALGGEGSEEALIGALTSIGVPLLKKTSSGKIATDKYTLQEFESDFPQVTALLEYRRVERFLTTYIAAVQGREVVHTNFNQCGAYTGRMSANRPNMQNFPKRAGKEVRSVFVPREGHVFVVADYEGIELRLLAYYLGDRGFRDLVGSDEYDPHAWVAAQIWGGEPREYGKGTPKESTHRGPAKNILYAITYGAGRKRVARMLRDAGLPSSENDAAAVISKIKASLPGYYSLTKRVRAKVESHGYVNTVMGRRNPVNRDKAYVGLSGLIQGSGADIMKQGLVNADAAVQPLGGIPLLVVHDELLVEVPRENAEEAQRAVDDAMCAAYPLDPPLSVESHICEKSYADD